jgi:hypothetical protein
VTEGRQVYSASATFLDLNGDENGERERWKEFAQGKHPPHPTKRHALSPTLQTGVYNYPISFEIPMNAPPSLHLTYGYVKWLLKAQVHRPGPLTKRLTCVRDVTLVPSPNTGPQDSGTRVFENFGDHGLRLVAVLPSTAYHMGSRIPIELTFQAQEKLNIYEISFSLEGKINFLFFFYRVMDACLWIHILPQKGPIIMLRWRALSAPSLSVAPSC